MWECCVGRGHTRQDRIRNECIGEKVGLVHVVENMVQICIRSSDGLGVWRRLREIRQSLRRI